jgi:hypothetical protein
MVLRCFIPKKIGFLKVEMEKFSMKVAQLKISWGKSPSLDVIQYNIIVIDENSQRVILDKIVSFAETQVLLEVEENSNITVTVVANNGFFDSEPVSRSYSLGNLTNPLPVSHIGIEVISTRESFVEASEEKETMDIVSDKLVEIYESPE